MFLSIYNSFLKSKIIGNSSNKAIIVLTLVTSFRSKKNKKNAGRDFEIKNNDDNIILYELYERWYQYYHGISII